MENENSAKPTRHPLSPGIKLLLLAVMALVLLIPQIFIDLLVDSRYEYSEEVQANIAQSWGGVQAVRPIWLSFPVEKKDKNDDTNYIAHYQVDSVKMDVDITTQTRYRGFYSAVLYHAKINVEGYIDPAALKEDVDIDGYRYDKISQMGYITTSIREPLGLKSNLVVNMAGKEYHLTASNATTLFDDGKTFSAPIDLRSDSLGKFSYTYELNGYKDLQFFVQSDAMDVNLKLHYPSPSFSGDFLPDDRTISDSVTTAHWRLFASASTFPQTTVRDRDTRYYEYDDELNPRSFSVSTQFTDVYYRAIERSLKYAILIIVFTFLTFFFTDTLSKTNMPMIGYLLTGCAILLFYTLLLSLSEYLAFGWAYLITCLAIIGMIGIYFWSFVRSLKATMVCVGILVILYVFLYLILQMDTFPLLVGSIFLFIVLGLVMYLSRKLTW